MSAADCPYCGLKAGGHAAGAPQPEGTWECVRCEAVWIVRAVPSGAVPE